MKTVRLVNPQQTATALQSLYRELKPYLLAEHRYVLTVAPERKSRSQENLYHKDIDDIAKQFERAGCKYDAEDMKRLLIQQFYIDTRNDPVLSREWQAIGGYRVEPSLDGGGFVMLGAQSRKFSKALASAFVDWLHAWGAENGIKFQTTEEYQ